MEKDDDLSVKVAVRIRPQLASEKIEMCQICTTVIPREKQVVLGKDKAFTFDYICDLHCLQAEVYETCADELVNGTFEGLNATLLAYGQTGSGKTYTMGTNFDVSLNLEQIGIIPRALDRLFNGIAERKQRSIEKNETPPEFKINAQFMELYNEEIFDLLDTTRDPSEKNRKSHIKIHEDAHGGIYTIGLTARPVVSQQDALLCLKTGTLLRSTASTNMNATSSRSHAVFTLHVRQQRIFKAEVNKDEQDGEAGDREGSGELPSGELEVLTAKFNFVDLAGSERLKRTGATGDRAKEGISINCGLLALGNVISALGDVEKRGCHVPYRDSKLTRLLQDSLGGNSRTTMIACISPSDRDFMETLNTLKYANRARNIRNKVVANKDMASCQLSAMRAEIQALQRELMEFKMGKQMSGVGENFHDAILENQMLQSENESLRQRVKSLQGTIDVMATRNAQLQTERDLSNLGGSAMEGESNEDVKKLLNGYIMETEQLRSKLTESESLVELMKQKRATPRSNSAFSDPFNCFSSMGFSFDPEDHTQQVISEAKADLENQLKVIHKREKMSESVEESQEQATVHNTEENDEGENSDVATSESDSETEENGRLEENLADLTCEISIKQKLIDELEASQKRLRMMKVQYEEKLTALENKIKQTESERDRVLSNLGSAESHATGKSSKAVREEYDQKLNSMQSELRKLQAAKREHSKMMHNQTHYETQLRTLQRELSDLKRMKVKLMKQLQEESQKSRQTEQKFKKEVNQMKKQERLKDNQIKNLENEKKKRDVVLKRKLEEVEALRRKERNLMSAKAAGRVGKHGKSYSEMGRLTDVRQLKTSWDNLEKLIGSIITKKKTLFHLDKDMERWIKQRETVGKKLERFLKKQEKAMSGDCVDAADLSDLNNHIECVRDNLAYIQENINECQNCIVSLEEMKDEDIEPVNVFVNSSVREALYLLERCTSFAINNGILAAQKEDECRELVAKLHQEQMESIFQRDMLQYLIQDKVDVEIDHGIIWQDIDAESSSSSASVSPVDSLDNQMYPLTFDASRTDGAEDLGLGQSNKCESPVALLENEPPPAIMKCESNVSLDSLCSDAINKDQKVTTEIPNVPKKLNSADNKSIKQVLLGAPHEQRSRHSDSSVSPVRKPTTSTKGQASPLADRKERKSDKLSRSAVDAARQTMSVGVISDVTNANVAGKGTFPLSHHHTAAGHSKAVLSIFATNDRLFSSGKDHTAKIWDLSAGVETVSFRNHPTSVVAVKFAEATGLVYTASAYLIKVWDPRLGSQCIYTFTSAGLVAESSNDGFSGPVICPPGEINISDIAISATGAMLYSAAGNTVRTWDMKMLRSIGKLYGGHQAAVMALAVNDVGLSSCNAVVATGSKDRCIKVFQLNRDLSGIISPRFSLEPTHCDGIESLYIADNLLFSGSRDMCIKKWDLNDGQLKQSITSAHRDWVSGLACLPPSDGRPSSGDGGMLLSICRAGSLKAWSTSNCCLIGETQAHVASINCITTSPSGLVFTGSSDRSIRIWKRSVGVVEKAV